MTDPSDEKIEVLVRSVLAAVDARLAEVRHEFQTLAAETELRNGEVLARLQALELRRETQPAENGSAVIDGDQLGARMEQATQVLLERIEAMHQRNTMATNERFAEINIALGQLSSGGLVSTEAAEVTTPVLPVPPAAPELTTERTASPAATAVTNPSLDAMDAPFQAGPDTDQLPVVATLSSPVTLPPIPPITSAPPREPNDEPVEPIDMSRLADLLSERLGSLSLLTPQ